MKTENDQLRSEVEKLKQRLREEITRTMAGVRLDLNLEKGRIRDEQSQQELKIKEVDTRIESEIAGLRTQIEQAKFSILQYLVGVATGAGALLVSGGQAVVAARKAGRTDIDPMTCSSPTSACSSRDSCFRSGNPGCIITRRHAYIDGPTTGSPHTPPSLDRRRSAMLYYTTMGSSLFSTS